MKKADALVVLMKFANVLNVVEWEFDGIDEGDEFKPPDLDALVGRVELVGNQLNLCSWKDSLGRIKHRLMDFNTHLVLLNDVPQVVSIDEWVMPIGKHSGKHLDEIPVDYLRWASENMKGNIQKRVLQFLRHHINENQLCF